jgi:hypothetical protein
MPGSSVLYETYEEDEALFLLTILKGGGHLPEPTQQTNDDTLQGLLQLMLLQHNFKNVTSPSES